jgi:hypothetical protein
MDEWPPVAVFGPRRGSAKNGAGSFQSETDLGGVPRFSRDGEQVIEPDFGARQVKESHEVRGGLVEA